MSSVHTVIRQAIKHAIEQGETQLSIAKKCGLSPANIYKYMNGDPEPKRRTLERFATGLNIPLHELGLSEGSSPKHARPNITHRLHGLMSTIDALSTSEINAIERLSISLLHRHHSQSGTAENTIVKAIMSMIAELPDHREKGARAAT